MVRIELEKQLTYVRSNSVATTWLSDCLEDAGATPVLPFHLIATEPPNISLPL